MSRALGFSPRPLSPFECEGLCGRLRAVQGGVRTEYEGLARDFRALAAHFDLAVEPRLEQELVLLCACFEAIDRHVDDTVDRERRAALGDEVLRALSDAERAAELPAELVPLLGALRRVLDARQAVAPFVRALRAFFETSEVMRGTRSAGLFVRCVLQEAACASAMTLLVAERLRSAAFDRFFLVLSEAANLVDKLHDVRGDRRRGEIRVRPGVVLHLRLAASLAVRGLRLLWLSPRPLRFLAWSARFLIPPPVVASAP